MFLIEAAGSAIGVENRFDCARGLCRVYVTDVPACPLRCTDNVPASETAIAYFKIRQE